MRETQRLRVRLRLRSLAEGGPDRRVRTGYRPHVRFNDECPDMPIFSGVEVTLDGADWVGPGQETIAVLRPLRPAFWPPLDPGATLPLCDGPREVGTAQVLTLFDEEG